MVKEELLQKLESVRKEIELLRTSLNKIREEKEKYYQKRDSLRLKINEKIKKIKDLKNRKDKDNIGFQEELKEREIVLREIRELIIKVKQLGEKRKHLRETKKIEKNPRLIKESLEKLELRIETEAVAYEEEKKLMKKVNQLKKEFKSVKEILDVSEEYNKVSKEIDNKKEKLDNLKNKINENMKSRSDYAEFMEISKNILELKKEMKDTNDNYLRLKSESLKTSLLLKEKLKEFDELKSQLNLADRKISEEKEIQKRDLINQKVIMVEEKLKRGQKLSTDDLITFQANK